MPLEIRELHIRAIVEETPTNHQNGQAAQTVATEELDVEDIIAQAVEAMIDILEEKKER